MTARKPKPGMDASSPDGSEAAMPDELPRERGDEHVRRIEEPTVCGFDPFVAFSEWAKPIDEEDYADL